jgi:mono/diheme cytochrome c family protein
MIENLPSLTKFCVTFVAALLALPMETQSVAENPTAVPVPAQIASFLDQYCSQCHGPGSDTGLDLSSIDGNLNHEDTLRLWASIHDQLAGGQMPPPDANQPTGQSRNAITSELADRLTQADRRRGQVSVRRLNRYEYEKSVRDLFDIYIDVKEILPPDSSIDGFDNVGEALAVSPEAALAYLTAADAVVDTIIGPSKPPAKIFHQTNLLDQKTHDGKPAMQSQIGKMFRQTDDGLIIFQSGYCPTNLVNFARLRAPAGTYRGTFRVRTVQSDKPVTLRIYGGDTIVGRREQHVVGYYDIPPGDWTTVEFVDRLFEPGGTFLPKCYGTIDTRKDADTYPEPGIEIGDITIEGPLEPWPPHSRTKLLGDVNLESATMDDLRKIVTEILPQVFRRPVGKSEADAYLSIGQATFDRGDTFESALRNTLKAILCSPSFLFFDERLDPRSSLFALASRLSYFLWSSVPDAELWRLAASGELANPKVLAAQVERMLVDPKSVSLNENFVGQWLRLREIDATSPDETLYPEYDELLRISMVEETQRFFAELINQDLSIMNLIDSDFAILNERLAKHYQIDGVYGQAFRPVTLPQDSVRGGMLTQASVLKVTANGTSTSPVVRGTWVLENILGRPVPPPPDGVSAVEPDIRGATTLREELQKHRDVESCNSCHRKIDPPGFALESFDVIGGYRDRYRSIGEGERPGFSRDPITANWIRYRIALPVDCSGELVDGRTFADIREFKNLLLENERDFAIAMTRKLATYGLGRRIGFSDRPEIEKIVDAAQQRKLGLRSLIHELVQSEMFRSLP